MIDQTKLQKRVGDFLFGPAGTINDPVLLEVATQHSTLISQKTISIPPGEIARRYAGEEKVLQSTKYDGEGVFVYFEASKQPFEIFAFNAPSGRVRVGLPSLQAFGARLRAAKVKRALFRAELYLPGMIEGRRHNVHDVLRVSASGNADEVSKLSLAVFDLLMLDGKDQRQTADFSATWELLAKYCGTDTSALVHRVEGSILPEKALLAVFEERVGAGQEGLVVRRLGRLELAKLKPELTNDAAIVGYVEGDFEGNYGVMSLLTAMCYQETGQPRDFQVLARVGSGFTDQQRQEMLDLLGPLKVKSPIDMTDSDGRTVHFVQPQLIAEVKAHDKLLAARNDRDNTTQLLAWNGKDWGFRGMTSFPRLLFPTFAGLRPDKDIRSGGARVAQLLPRVTEPPAPRSEGQRSSQIFRREIWTKEQKGEVMVRKLVMTKIEGDPEAFPYVVFWTDFSAKRKEPLKVDTAYAFTETRAQALAEQFITEGIVRGWVKRT